MFRIGKSGFYCSIIMAVLLFGLTACAGEEPSGLAAGLQGTWTGSVPGDGEIVTEWGFDGYDYHIVTYETSGLTGNIETGRFETSGDSEISFRGQVSPLTGGERTRAGYTVTCTAGGHSLLVTYKDTSFTLYPEEHSEMCPICKAAFGSVRPGGLYGQADSGDLIPAEVTAVTDLLAARSQVIFDTEEITEAQRERFHDYLTELENSGAIKELNRLDTVLTYHTPGGIECSFIMENQVEDAGTETLAAGRDFGARPLSAAPAAARAVSRGTLPSGASHARLDGSSGEKAMYSPALGRSNSTADDYEAWYEAYVTSPLGNVVIKKPSVVFIDTGDGSYYSPLRAELESAFRGRGFSVFDANYIDPGRLEEALRNNSVVFFHAATFHTAHNDDYNDPSSSDDNVWGKCIALDTLRFLRFQDMEKAGDYMEMFYNRSLDEELLGFYQSPVKAVPDIYITPRFFLYYFTDYTTPGADWRNPVKAFPFSYIHFSGGLFNHPDRQQDSIETATTAYMTPLNGAMFVASYNITPPKELDHDNARRMFEVLLERDYTGYSVDEMLSRMGTFSSFSSPHGDLGAFLMRGETRLRLYEEEEPAPETAEVPPPPDVGPPETDELEPIERFEYAFHIPDYNSPKQQNTTLLLYKGDKTELRIPDYAATEGNIMPYGDDMYEKEAPVSDIASSCFRPGYVTEIAIPQTVTRFSWGSLPGGGGNAYSDGTTWNTDDKEVLENKLYN